MKDLISQLRGEAYEFKEPWRATEKSLTIIVPIVTKKAGTRGYAVLEEVKDKVKIEDTGHIGEAKIAGDVDKPTFIPGGTMLKGATQARATQFGIVVIPQKTEQIPIQCIHASRGIRAGATFTPAGQTPRKVYSMMLAHRNQSYTWNAVSNYSAMALADVPQVTVAPDNLVGVVEETQRFREDLTQLLKGIPNYVNQVGTVIIDTDGVLGLEMYDHPDSWKAFADSIMRSHAEALAKEDKLGIFKPDMQAIIPIIFSFLDEIEKSKEEEVFNRNNARTVILKAEGYVGEYTELNAKTIHLLITRKEKQPEKEPVWAEPARRAIRTSLERLSATPMYQTAAPSTASPMTKMPSESTAFYAVAQDVTTSDWLQRRKNKWKPILNHLEKPKTWTNLKSELPIAKATLADRIRKLQQIGAIEKRKDENGTVRYYATGLGQELKKKSE